MKRKTPLYVSILWFTAFIIWAAGAALKIASPYTDESTVILAVLAALANLAAALVNLRRWKRDKDDPNKV